MIQVLKPGFLTSIQDKGRFGYRHSGVPISGAMDEVSSDMANALLGNSKDAAVMEITLSGPELLFESDTAIAISGAMMSPTINDNELFNDEVYRIKAGSILKFGKLVRGIRCYLAVSGGFNTKKVLGSRSWYFSVTGVEVLSTGKRLPIAENRSLNKNPDLTAAMVHNYNSSVIEVEQGPEFDLLSEAQKAQLFNGIFNIAKENNRMAYQLKQQIYKHTYSILTSSTLPGTVQLTPSGKLIILMKDAQTTGGYPRVLQLTEASIALLSQKSTSDEVDFTLK
ncbi:biotin-dependent carboxyltransferase family protein [Galbibacter sp.]|uniref:5-oxoprolinase subunit C family protein n=1 Tax=Galbibacter sp. TaxID=2918471 RepID=UPI003A8DFA90